MQDASRFGATFRVFLVKGKRRISCKRARQIVKKPPLESDQALAVLRLDQGRQRPVVRRYYRQDLKVSIGAIMREPSGR